MPVQYAVGPVKVTFNGADITQAVDVAELDEFVRGLEIRHDELPPPTISMSVSGQWFHLTPVRVRSAAPIAACLRRRTLDGGNWRKRGHPAHRR